MSHLKKPLSQLIEINPHVKLEKEVAYPFIPMEELSPGKRYVRAKLSRIAGGGAKFCHGDTLFARITPCLENGKIAQYISDPGQLAFGSTEYWIFRARKGISDPAYVFYLANSEIIRKPAEKSMAGASGRQRADIAAVENISVPAPPLPIQRRIASILSAYDDLIENNTRRIAILEEMARRIYEEWFVKFKFPGHEKVKMVDSELGKIPEGWKIETLGEYAFITMGQSPKSEFYNQDGNGLPFHQGVTDFGRHFPIHRMYCTAQARIANNGDILMSVRAPVGRINLAPSKMVIGRGLCAMRSKSGQQRFLLHLLLEKFREEDSMGNGAIFNAVTKEEVYGICFPLPSLKLLNQFETVVEPFWGRIENLTKKNSNLRTTRDFLLPKLISGEIDVSKLPDPKEAAA